MRSGRIITTVPGDTGLRALHLRLRACDFLPDFGIFPSARVRLNFVRYAVTHTE